MGAAPQGMARCVLYCAHVCCACVCGLYVCACACAHGTRICECARMRVCGTDIVVDMDEWQRRSAVTSDYLWWHQTKPKLLFRVSRLISHKSLICCDNWYVGLDGRLWLATSDIDNILVIGNWHCNKYSATVSHRRPNIYRLRLQPNGRVSLWHNVIYHVIFNMLATTVQQMR